MMSDLNKINFSLSLKQLFSLSTSSLICAVFAEQTCIGGLVENLAGKNKLSMHFHIENFAVDVLMFS